MSNDSWYYAANGLQIGPVSSDVLRQMLAGGQLTPEDFVWREGLAQWQAMSAVPGFAALPSADPDAENLQPDTQPGGPQPDYPTASLLHYEQAPAVPSAYDPTLHYSNKFVRSRYTDTAYVAMVIAIMGLLFLRIIFGPVSLGMGIWALVGLCKHGIHPGRGLAITAIVVGGFVTVMMILAIAAISVM